MTRGRYAPSPSGEIHVGNASTALLAWLSVRSAGGRMVMRIEDLDAARARPGAVEALLADLSWLGLDWDEGPDVGGPHGPYVQTDRGARYDEAFRRLLAGGRLYRCFCRRKDVAAAASAPQEPGEEAAYPGTCGSLSPGESDRRAAEGARFSWRFRVTEPAPAFVDRVRGLQPAARPGDFIVRRSDGVPAYQLAVVVDDAAMGITEVVRGNDLLPSVARQRLLQDALGLPAPTQAHVPLLAGPDGHRISKRHGGSTLRELRQRGLPAEEVVGRLAALLGLLPEERPAAPPDLIPGFRLERLAGVPPQVRVDPASWEAGSVPARRSPRPAPR